jgi:hypothetical protein
MLLSGCSGKKDGTATVEGMDGTEVEFVDVKATADTGIIRGVVVDEAIRPIPGAQVSVNTSDKTLVTNTSTSGAFGFEGLKPGTYFVKAQKLGFTGVQTSVEVVAGVQDVKVVKIALEVDKSYVKPYYNVVKYDGFVECTTSVLVLCGLPNLLTGDNITNDRFTWDQYFEDNATLIQSEMFWESTQAASTALYFEMETLDSGCTGDGTLVNRTSGDSPIYTRVFNDQVQEASIGTQCPIYYSIFSGDAVASQAGGTNPTCRVPTGLPPPAPSQTPCVGVGATVQQSFTMVIHSFYGFMPSPTWRFSTEGHPVAPL